MRRGRDAGGRVSSGIHRFIAQAAIAVPCLLAFASAALAAPGTLSMSWGACSPILSDVADPPAGVLSLVFSVEGNDETHAGYQVRFLPPSSPGDGPDAWGFEGWGWQG